MKAGEISFPWMFQRWTDSCRISGICFFYHLTLLLLLWCSTNPDENNDKRNFKFWRAVIKWFNFWHCIRVAAKLSVVYWTKITIRNYVNPQNTNLNEHVWHNLCLKQGMRKLWADPMLPFFLPKKADHMRVKRDRGESILGGFDSRPTADRVLVSSEAAWEQLYDLRHIMNNTWPALYLWSIQTQHVLNLQMR